MKPTTPSLEITQNKVASQGTGKEKLWNKIGSLFPCCLAKSTKQVFSTVQELREASTGNAPRITKNSRNRHPWQAREGNWRFLWFPVRIFTSGDLGQGILSVQSQPGHKHKRTVPRLPPESRRTYHLMAFPFPKGALGPPLAEAVSLRRSFYLFKKCRQRLFFLPDLTSLLLLHLLTRGGLRN